MALDKPFRLTPGTGDRLRAVESLVADHNVRQALPGHDTAETSTGRSLMMLIGSRAALALARTDAGILSLDAAPVAGGGALTVPATTLRLQGEPIRLAAQAIPTTSLGLGDYAVVVEAYRALVGPTSAGRQTEPVMFNTVTDARLKPSATTLYPAGCVDLTAGPSDEPLVTASVQTQKFEQWQYRVRLVPDLNLAGLDSEWIPRVPLYPELPESEKVPGATYAHVGDGLHVALLPDLPAAYERAYDRRLYACKLGVLRVGAAGAQLLTRGLTDEPGPGLGAPCAVVLPGRLALARETAAALAAQAARIADLEARRGALSLRINEAMAVTDELMGGTTLSRTVAFPPAAGTLGAVQHDPAGNPARVTAREACRLRVSASATFAPGMAGVRGLRVLVDGVPTGITHLQSAAKDDPAAVSLAGEIELSVGQHLALEVVQRSGAVLLVTDCVMGVSRVS